MKTLLTLITVTAISLLFIGCSERVDNTDMAIKLTPKYQKEFLAYEVDRLISHENSTIEDVFGAADTVYMFDRLLNERLNFTSSCMISNEVLDFYIVGFEDELLSIRTSEEQVVRYGKSKVFNSIDLCLGRMLKGLNNLNEEL